MSSATGRSRKRSRSKSIGSNRSFNLEAPFDRSKYERSPHNITSSSYESLMAAKKIKNANSRILQSLESRFKIMQRNEDKMLNRIEVER